VPRRYALVLPVVTLVFLAAISQNVWAGERGVKRAGAGALFTGIRVGERDWIDRALPDGATAAFVWTGASDRFAVNQNEFFNRSVGPIYYIGGPTPGALAETEVQVDEESGELRTASGERLDARYLLTEDRISPEGTILARDPGIGLTLWRVAGPLLATTTQVEGLYPGDTWSGPEVTWTRERCRGGTLTVLLGSDPNLYHEDQVVTAYVNGEVAGRATIAPFDLKSLRVQTVPSDGTCRVVFRTAKTLVPGGGDPRPLGAHFRAFEYRP
jgi:hypothetical protein